MVKKNYRRELVLLSILVLAAIIYFSRTLNKPAIKVISSNTKIVKSNFDFIYEHWKEPKLLELAKQENYKEIKANDEFQLYLELCNWVHNQWPESVPDPYPLSNALDILKDIRSGKTGGFCGQYAYVLADVLKSMGYFAVRYVELWSKEKESHFVVEAWSNKYAKWVVLDANHNLYYELKDSGTPAGALEIRQSLFGGKAVVARSAQKQGQVKDDFKKHLYANIAVSLRSDLLRHNKPLTVQDRFVMFLFYKDANSGSGHFEKGIPYLLTTGRVQDIDYDCNRVRCEYDVDDQNQQVKVRLYTDGSTPNFKCFAVSRDKGKSWIPFKGNSFVVKKNKTQEQALWVTALNMYDRQGPVTTLRVIF